VTVLDVACGQGLATRAVAARGAARVGGIDSAPQMIEHARRHSVPEDRDVSYQVGDAQRLDNVEDASVDGVTCQLALMDIGDLDATLRSIHRVLKPSGWFVFVIAHPCFLAPDALLTATQAGRPAITITDYFEERFWRSSNPNGVRRVGNYHRTLSTYLNALVRSKFTLEAVDEPRAGPLLAEQQPLYADVPMFFAARARRN
jgi:ubiquinone/menaquinone biosynthesis C-methylase UbiE